MRYAAYALIAIAWAYIAHLVLLQMWPPISIQAINTLKISDAMAEYAEADSERALEAMQLYAAVVEQYEREGRVLIRSDALIGAPEATDVTDQFLARMDELHHAR